MEEKSDIKRVLKAMFIGGPGAVISLFALLGAFVFANEENINYLYFSMAILILLASSLFTLWATGFWGRWGMMLFFVIAPILIVADYAVNPFFPSGVIIFAAICYGLYEGRDKKQHTS